MHSIDQRDMDTGNVDEERACVVRRLETPNAHQYAAYQRAG